MANNCLFIEAVLEDSTLGCSLAPLPAEPAIPNLRLPRVQPALGFARSRPQTVEHKVKQVIPGVEGEVLSERAQVFEEGLARG